MLFHCLVFMAVVHFCVHDVAHFPAHQLQQAQFPDRPVWWMMHGMTGPHRSHQSQLITATTMQCCSKCWNCPDQTWKHSSSSSLKMSFNQSWSSHGNPWQLTHWTSCPKSFKFSAQQNLILVCHLIDWHLVSQSLIPQVDCNHCLVCRAMLLCSFLCSAHFCVNLAQVFQFILQKTLGCFILFWE